MKPPIEPKIQDCCNSGCNPCIFEVYEKQLTLFKKYQETGDHSVLFKRNAISQTVYTVFVLVDNVELCESHRLLCFKLKVPEYENKYVTWSPGDHFLFKFEGNNNSCTRAYTPLKLKVYSTQDFDFSIIVKSYHNGLVSPYLANLKPGVETLWRGPYGPYDDTPNKFNRIIMIAQGTGIAPFISIIDHIINNDDDMTRIILYYCCRNLDKILLRDHLYSLNSFWNFTYKIFLVNPTKSEYCKYQEPLNYHKLSFDDFIDLKPFTERDQFLICGSNEFMKYYEQWLKVTEQFNKNVILF